MITETSTVFIALTKDIKLGVILLVMLLVLSIIDFLRRILQLGKH